MGVLSEKQVKKKKMVSLVLNVDFEVLSKVNYTEHQFNVGLEVIGREVTFGTMETEKLSDKMLMDKTYETEILLNLHSSMLCGQLASEGYSKEENSHSGHRGQRSSRGHSTRVFKGKFQPQV